MHHPYRSVALLAVAGTLVATQLLPAAASTPASSTLTTPSTAGGRTAVAWTGTIPAGSNPQSTCSTPGTDDQHALRLVVPAGSSSLKRVLSVAITWTPAASAMASDEVLTLLGPGGKEVASADSSSTTETVVVNDPAAGAYTAVACGYVNAAAQAYRGSAVLTTKAAATSPASSLPTVSQGLSFGASTPSDVQRSIGEPAVTTDRGGNIYTCGPSGFTNIADYANVSTDGGDQFHLLGQPPRGQVSGGEGGGDCALATAVKKNALGQYQLAYAGLGPLTNFATATSADTGRTLQVSPVSESVPGVDRQWIAFLDDKTAFLTYNQMALNKVVQKSVDGGLTYDAPGVQAANEGGRIGQIRAFTPPGKSTATQGVVYFPYSTGTKVKLAVSRDSGKSYTTCVLADAGVSPDAGFVGADNDDAGNIYGTWAEKTGSHAVYLVALPASRFATCTGGRQAATNKRIQVSREGVNTGIMPWVAASGKPGRVAVAFYGTRSIGDANLPTFKATWNVFVSQSVDALSVTPHIDQVQATTHPFHFDSICLDGLNCTINMADRTLVDYFTMEYNRGTGRLSIVYSNAAKKPGEVEGHVSQPTVLIQSTGPSNGGGTLTARHPVVATGSSDPAGDALSQYSTVLARTLPSVNSKALDLRKVAVTPAGKDLAVTLKVSDLSDAALRQALQDNAPATSLVWVFRWVNGYQPVAVSMHWDPVRGFRAGYDDYTTDRTVGGTVQKYPGAVALTGAKANQAAGTLSFRVPNTLLRGLVGPSGNGQRPAQQKAVPGTRFYDGFAGSFADVTTSTQVAGQTSTQSYLYQADNAPTFDFLLAARTVTPVVSRVALPSAFGRSGATPGRTSASPGGRLAATGLDVGLPWLAALTLGGAALVLRRRRVEG